MKICIFGASSVHIDKKYVDITEELGHALAKNGHSLVFGAGKNGLMGAAARGFKRGGGHIHGVIPEFFQESEVEPIYNECDKLTFTKTMSERKRIMEDDADAFVVAPGGVGTFEEYFEVLTLKQLGRHNKAIAIFNIGGYYDKLEQFMETAAEQRFINFGRGELYDIFDNVPDVIKYLETYKPKHIQWQKKLK